jgi:VanZ family protein
MNGGWLADDARWRHWYRRALPAYWLFLVCVTHFPRLQLGTAVPKSDKLAHIVAYGVLAFLFWRFVETFRRPLGGGFVWLAGVLLAAYAAIDEWTQGLVGRSVDLADFVANLIGIAIVLLPLEVWRRRTRPTA